MLILLLSPDTSLGRYSNFKYKVYADINTASCLTWGQTEHDRYLTTIVANGVRHSEPVFTRIDAAKGKQEADYLLFKVQNSCLFDGN